MKDMINRALMKCLCYFESIISVRLLVLILEKDIDGRQLQTIDLQLLGNFFLRFCSSLLPSFIPFDCFLNLYCFVILFLFERFIYIK